VGELDAAPELVGALRRIAAARVLAGDLRGAQAVGGAIATVEHAGKACDAAAAAMACDRFHLAYELQLDALDSWRSATELLVAALDFDGVHDESPEIDLREGDKAAADDGRGRRTRRRRRREERSAEPPPALTVDDMIRAHVAPGPAVTYDAWVDRLHDQRVVLKEAARLHPSLPARPRPPGRRPELDEPRLD
jgi:hypothetical protein